MNVSIDMCAQLSDSDAIRAAERQIKVVNPLAQKGWDALVLSNPNHSFFHGSSWAEVLSATYKYTPCYFVESDQDRLVALFPVMEVDSFLTGRRGISLPFTDECQPLVTDASFYPGMLQKIIQHGARRRWNYLECRASVPFLLRAHARDFRG
jgi:hypothetical protein